MGGTLLISGTQSGIPTGEAVIGPFNVPMSNVDETLSVTLAQGDNTFALPAAIEGVIIMIPANQTGVVKLKGAGADTGVPLSVLEPTVLEFPSGGVPASIILNASVAGTSPTTVRAI